MRRIVISFFVWGFALWIVAQNGPQSLITEYGGVYSPYKVKTSSLTPVPKGYSPFYISHVSRHGSRYPVEWSYVNNALQILETSNRHGVLTNEGRRLLESYKTLDSICDKMYGMLCTLGADEHQGIARRMVKRFPEVFSSQHRIKVNAVSTDKPRCITSAANFCSALASSCNRLEINVMSGPKYTSILCNDAGPFVKSNNKKGGRLSDEYMQSHFDYESFYGRFYVSMEAARRYNSLMRFLPENVYVNGTVAHYLGYDGMLDLMTPEEYRQAAISYNSKMYYSHCDFKGMGKERIRLQGEMLKGMIEDADNAMKSASDMVADLRFSHDTGMMPLFSLMGLSPFPSSVAFDKVFSNWNSSYWMCMATNLQMVFYQKENSVIVKFMLNECEVTIPALQAIDGVYYPWDTVKAYWNQLLMS